ncbi:putative membrane protein YdjX (TVP38/TMEM64 family) [Bradyrhizobium japonicum USDA 38]|uniref:TVP38/TMEM64 family protein n=1 Tax=Bradyrhizobium japonicum TaxID=375 RepID=UPI0009B7C0BF|nr:VTT domain-containing protein [Bradyrhizobium japonicum]MCS3896130.1 putative membrane protein YdjX (TVP38/TMEM64 family) [Bradyrhizobium japonicum USDA 38]MCS3948644.1 putative membrane protein YdjX (TVP38/TMEM64 family) [Bradyrhizobium japonicum]MCW2218623.1 putative membrane protein YdjX (TVP38/TMEM64 family) [Bradyrhizobium japonicum]MCW2343237.1 putative membrane protein YdjX (TVP38/TMEM64 family) [Bradyrhizobium japonicum]
MSNSSLLDTISAWFLNLGSLTPGSVMAVGLVFVAMAFIALPRTPLICAAGAAFGWKVAVIILLSGTVGAMLAFLTSRYVASNWFRKKLERKPNFGVIAQAVDEEGWRIVALMRLGVPLPGAVQNYLFGLTRIDIATYSISTFVFTAPQVFLYSFLGATGRASLLDENLGLSLIAMALIIAIVALIAWRVRALLSQRAPLA